MHSKMEKEKTTLTGLLFSAPVAGNILFILWILYNGINEGFQGTLLEKVQHKSQIVDCCIKFRKYKGVHDFVGIKITQQAKSFRCFLRSMTSNIFVGIKITQQAKSIESKACNKKIILLKQLSINNQVDCFGRWA
jgi:hypothetical protein